MLRPLLILTAAAGLAACAPNTPATGTSQAPNADISLKNTRAHLAAVVTACGSLLSGNGFSSTTLTRAGYIPANGGNSYRKPLAKGSFANPNGSFIQVSQTRRGACNVQLFSHTTLQLGSAALTQELAAQGWQRDQSSRTRIYRKGNAALVVDGGSYSNITTFALKPA